MTEAEFERRQQTTSAAATVAAANDTYTPEPAMATEPETNVRGTAAAPARGRGARPKAAAKPRRVQRMFAIEEELDKKLWLYAIHIGKDRSEVVNDLLRPLVASMVLYDSRDRRATRAAEADRALEGDDAAA